MAYYCIDCKHVRNLGEDLECGSELYCGALQFCVQPTECVCELFEDKFTEEQRRFLELAKQIIKEDHDLLIALRDA